MSAVRVIARYFHECTVHSDRAIRVVVIELQCRCIAFLVLIHTRKRLLLYMRVLVKNHMVIIRNIRLTILCFKYMDAHNECIGRWQFRWPMKQINIHVQCICIFYFKQHNGMCSTTVYFVNSNDSISKYNEQPLTGKNAYRGNFVNFNLSLRSRTLHIQKQVQINRNISVER